MVNICGQVIPGYWAENHDKKERRYISNTGCLQCTTANTAKDKSKEIANKLERFAHNPSQSTGKISQPRSSLSPSTAPKGPGSHNTFSKMASMPSSPMVAGAPDLSLEETSMIEEPSLREVLTAVNGCKSALSEMMDQFKKALRKKWLLSDMIYSRYRNVPLSWRAGSVGVRM